MGNSDDDSDCAEYGTPLEALEEDEAVRKRPITVSEQIAVDERGRRRFHGAFTGGFSAGYFNTVGSKEGWAPSTFKSSRGDRNASKTQSVLDFMDDEDKGAFGIAPQVLRPTDDFTDKNDGKGRKRPLPKSSDGPIPGVPVLDQIIQPVKETVGIKILIKMGWRHGKGIGPNIERRSRKKARLEEKQQPETGEEENNHAESDVPLHIGKVYGCPLPPEFIQEEGSDSDGVSDVEVESLFAPEDVNSIFCNPKENTFGLGYRGLDRNTLTATNSGDLFGAKLKFRVENKNLSISGEAFGVGAFEENDDDIYSREDMSQYDFALETPEERRQRKARESRDKKKATRNENCIEGFRISDVTKFKRKRFPAPTLPPNFQPVHLMKKSRFESSTLNNEKLQVAAQGLGRHSLTISERQVLIEENPTNLPPNRPDNSNQSASTDVAVEETSGSKFKQTSETDTDIQKRIERLKKFTQVLQAYKAPDESKAMFKPFMKNPEKQERYEKYITLVEAGFSESLRDLQPPEMTEWERDREKMEFERASKLYKPMTSILSSRFVSAKSHDISHLEPEKEFVKEKDPQDDPKVASKMSLFGRLTHRVLEWHPDKLVCKRFNVPNPYPDSTFVGIKGDPSGRIAKSIDGSTPGDTSVNVKPPDPPKKSLFADLDFSKPPPGLLPVEATSSVVAPKDSSGEAAAGSVLDFQKTIIATSAVETSDEDSPIQKPPLDLFKEIFADSSESEDEDQSEANEPNPNTSRHTVTENVRADSNSDKKDLGPLVAETVNQNTGYKKRVFDNIDLDSLQGEERHARNKSFSVQSGDKNSDSGEDITDTYGPLPPNVKTSYTRPNNSNVPGNFSKSSSFSRTSVNYVSQKPSTTEKEVIWVEKSALTDRSDKSHVKSKKHSGKKTRRKSSKKEKRKGHKSSRHKHKKKSHKHSSKSKKDTSESSDDSGDSPSDSDASSNSSIIINDSLDNKALLAKLKKIAR